MKKLIFTMILGCIFASEGYAQFYSVNLNGPQHPLQKYESNRTSADTIYSYNKDGMFETKTIISRSADGLTDTLYISSGIAGIFVEHYSEDNQLLSIYEYFPDMEYVGNYTKTEYEYDNEGRMTKIRNLLITPRKNPSDSITSETIFDYKNDVEETENGYIFTFRDRISGKKIRWEHELDSLGRVTHLKCLDTKDEYKEFSDGKKYRVDDGYYSYTDSSCIYFAYERVGNLMPGMPDRWVKSYYAFDENGNFKKTVTSSIDGINWSIYSADYSIYKYANENPDNNEQIEQTNIKVYGAQGEITIVSDKNVAASVYNYSGQLIKQQNISVGSNKISISKGLYIVTVGDRSFKVFVQ